MSNIHSINISAKKNIQKLKLLLYKKLKNNAIAKKETSSVTPDMLVRLPHFSEISSISKLRTPQMKFFAESKLGLNAKIDILTNEYSKIFAKEKYRNNLMKTKIKRRIKDKINNYKSCLDFGYEYVLNLEDAKYRTIIKTSLLIGLGNLTLIGMQAMNIPPLNQNEIYTGCVCAFDAIMLFAGFHKYSKLKKAYHEEDVHDLLYLLKQEKNK